MEGINHAGHGAARPQNSGLPFFGLDDPHMIPDDFSFGSPFSPTDSNQSNTNDNPLQDSIFPEWKTGAPRGGDNPNELQKEDPLAAQIWRLYTRTKSQLPNQERMENLTWRMMAMSLKRKEREQLALAQQQQQQQQQARYLGPISPPCLFPPPLHKNPTVKSGEAPYSPWLAGPHK
jgi:GATA-binding protein